MDSNLTPLERLTRMFNMGRYGENLAQEILDQHAHDLADRLRAFKAEQPAHWGGARIDVMIQLIDPKKSDDHG